MKFILLSFYLFFSSFVWAQNSRPSQDFQSWKGCIREELNFDSKIEQANINGLLIRPENTEQAPLIILLSDFEADHAERREELFYEVATFFARNGFATYQTNFRDTTVFSGEIPFNLLISDTQMAFDLLSSYSKINNQQIGFFAYGTNSSQAVASLLNTVNAGFAAVLTETKNPSLEVLFSQMSKPVLTLYDGSQSPKDATEIVSKKLLINAYQWILSIYNN